MGEVSPPKIWLLFNIFEKNQIVGSAGFTHSVWWKILTGACKVMASNKGLFLGGGNYTYCHITS